MPGFYIYCVSVLLPVPGLPPCPLQQEGRQLVKICTSYHQKFCSEPSPNLK